MSTARALEAVRDLLVAPTRPWDALICKSRAVRDLVTGVLERHAAHLAERTGGRMALPLQLPVIPLGIEMPAPDARSEEHTSELQSLMRISYAVFCLKKKKQSENTIP